MVIQANGLCRFAGLADEGIDGHGVILQLSVRQFQPRHGWFGHATTLPQATATALIFELIAR